MNALNTIPENKVASPQDALLAQLMQCYAHFNGDTVDTIAQLYHQDCVFIDPVKTLTGRDQLHGYFSAMAEGLLECRFTFHHIMSDNSTGDMHEASLFWDMHYRHKKLRGGEPLTLAGTSHLKYSDTIVYHRDYYDLGQMLYQHLPLIGQVIAVIKKRI